LKSFSKRLFEHIFETELFHKLTIAPKLNMSRFIPKFTESDREAETKRHFRQRADAAWKQYNAIYQQLTERHQ